MGSETHHAWKYYRCRGSFRFDKPCRTPLVPVARVHQQLETLYRQTVLSASTHRAILHKILWHRATIARQANAGRQAIELEMDALRQREIVLARGLAAGLIGVTAHETGVGDLAVKRSALQQELAALREDRRMRVDDLRSRSGTAWDLHVALTLDEQRILAEELFERIELIQAGIGTFLLRSSRMLPAAA